MAAKLAYKHFESPKESLAAQFYSSPKVEIKGEIENGCFQRNFTLKNTSDIFLPLAAHAQAIDHESLVIAVKRRSVDDNIDPDLWAIDGVTNPPKRVRTNSESSQISSTKELSIKVKKEEVDAQVLVDCLKQVCTRCR